MIWSFTLAAVGILGLWLAGRNNHWGWAVGLGAQALWLAYAITTHQWGFIATALAYGWVYATNFLRWRQATHATNTTPPAPTDPPTLNGPQTATIRDFSPRAPKPRTLRGGALRAWCPVGELGLRF